MKINPPEEDEPGPEAGAGVARIIPPCNATEKTPEPHDPRRRLSRDQKELMEWRQELL